VAIDRAATIDAPMRLRVRGIALTTRSFRLLTRGP